MFDVAEMKRLLHLIVVCSIVPVAADHDWVVGCADSRTTVVNSSVKSFAVDGEATVVEACMTGELSTIAVVEVDVVTVKPGTNGHNNIIIMLYYYNYFEFAI